jgi:hypothetical protein
MRRRLSGVVLATVAVLLFAAPAYADTVPGPGNFRDSGSSEYVNGWTSECGPSTCTDTSVYASVTRLQGGGVVSYICVDRFTYPARRGGHVTGESGCADGVAVTIGDTTATASATVFVETCGARSCTGENVAVSLSMTAIGASNGYSYTQKQEYENCTDTYRVRGQARDAEGTISVDGTTLDAFGQIGSETFAFSSRCR